jgi:Undecaprenyl-phosphate galactose phosphotransferase WbaP
MATLHQPTITDISLRPARGTEPRAAGWMARPRTCSAILLLADLAALSLGAALSVLIWRHFGINFSTEFYLRLWPVLLLFPAAYAASGLYPGFGRNPADELRKLSISTSVVYAALAVTIFLLKDSVTYSRGTFLLAWANTLILVPLLRAAVRWGCARKPWWGHPVVIVGARRVSVAVAAMLESQPALGFRPVAVFEDPELAAELARQRRVRHVILAMADVPPRKLRTFFDYCSEEFSDVIVIPDLGGVSSLWAEARDLRGMLGLEVRQRLLVPRARLLKRVLDVLLVILAGILAAPLILLLAILIKLSSAGPVFYGQRRCGLAGEPFTAWKFRSMVANANQVLEQYLASDPRLREEWRRSHKLKNDPRITRLGLILRRTSLDELPQLWNVLRGQMSLVGPRPIVAEEIPRYGDGIGLYKKVRPGLTGLWQVSGRNNVSYEQRVNFDLYYVRNWSLWLDVYVLARTVKVVLWGDGAF